MVWMAIACMNAQNVRETVRLDEGWKFALGNAADPKKDFGCGTEYFNYLTKANSIHNEGPYVAKFDDSAWQEIRVPYPTPTGQATHMATRPWAINIPKRVWDGTGR